MYLIQNIKKNILSKFVSNMVCGDCSYVYYKKDEDFNDIINNAKEKLDVEFSQLEKKHFQLFSINEDMEQSAKKVGIQVNNNVQFKKFNKLSLYYSSVMDKKDNVIFLSNKCIFKLPSSEESKKYEENGLVPFQLLGYFEQDTYNHDATDFDPFIKIVEPSVFDKKEIITTSLAITLDSNLFTLCDDGKIDFHKDKASLEKGTIYFIANQFIVYKPNNQNIAISIGRINSNFDAMKKFVGHQVFIENNLPEGCKIIDGFDKINGKKKIQIQKQLEDAQKQKEESEGRGNPNGGAKKGNTGTFFLFFLLGVFCYYCVKRFKGNNTDMPSEQSNEINNKISPQA